MHFPFRYVYSRFQTKSSSGLRRLLSMFVTFAFIYVWHGYFMAIFVWSMLNVTGMLLEQLVRKLQRSNIYQEWIIKKFSANAVNRIDAAIGTHLLILAVISNFFFLANYEVGILFLKKAYLKGIGNYFSLSLSILVIYFTSEYCKRRISFKKSER